MTNEQRALIAGAYALLQSIPDPTVTAAMALLVMIGNIEQKNQQEQASAVGFKADGAWDDNCS